MQFKTFLDGLTYQRKCPLCKKNMTIDERDYIERLEYPLGHEYQRFAFPLSRQSEDILYVSTASEKVELKLGTYCNNMIVYGTTALPRPIHTSQVYNGRVFQALNIACDECCQYKYTLKLEADISAGKLASTSLNSEFVSIDEGGKTHEIRTVYAADKTEYSVFSSDRGNGDSKVLELPLIPMDLKNPKETLARIQRLIIFS